MTYTFRRKLMYTNKSPRRIDRKAGGRSKKVNVGQLRSKNEKSINKKICHCLSDFYSSFFVVLKSFFTFNNT